MEAFTSIESFKTIVQQTRKYFGEKNLPLPTHTFIGTVKLHGSNASVRYVHATGELIPQSRNRVLSLDSDNAGFAWFVETHKQAILDLILSIYPHDNDGSMYKELTLFGEWCGGNIQKKVALSEAPKHWVLFAMKLKLSKYGDDTDAIYVPLPDDVYNNSIGVYNIYQIPTYEVTVDFLNPEHASQELYDLTLAVEKEDPWVKTMFGISGIGEGIVWAAKDHPGLSRAWFKTKGLLHKNEGDTSKVHKIQIDDDKLASIKELVQAILPEWRLEQGVSYLKENDIDLTPQNTGNYLKWIAKDILKEETSTIAASGFDWKQVQGQVMQTARNYYLTEIQKEFS